MKGPTICRLPCGSARRTSKPSPRSRVRGTMTSSSASQVLGSPSTGSLEGSQLMENSLCFEVLISANPVVVPANAPDPKSQKLFAALASRPILCKYIHLWLWAPAFAGTTREVEVTIIPPLKPGARLLRIDGPVIETARLILRPWRSDDIAANTAMLSDRG